MQVKRLAVFVSGQGTGLQGLYPALPELGLELVLVAADRPCPAMAWARQQAIPTAEIVASDGPAIKALLTHRRVELVLLSGYLRLVPPEVVAAYRWRMLNIHPSLLPAFPGRDAIRQALEYGVKVTGATLHLVDEGLDTGPIVLQEAVPVEPEDDWQRLRDRLRPVEQRLMREGLRLLAQKTLVVEGRRVRWR